MGFNPYFCSTFAHFMTPCTSISNIDGMPAAKCSLQNSRRSIMMHIMHYCCFLRNSRALLYLKFLLGHKEVAYHLLHQVEDRAWSQRHSTKSQDGLPNSLASTVPLPTAVGPLIQHRRCVCSVMDFTIPSTLIFSERDRILCHTISLYKT